MKTNIKYIFGLFFLLLFVATSCSEETYSLGNLTAPTNVVINAEIVGKNTANPDGDGSGKVNFTITGDNILGSKIDYDANDALEWMILTGNSGSKTFNAATGVHTYRVSVVAYGAGGASTNVTKDITVRYDFTPDAAIVTNLTNNSSKTWIVDKSVEAHFGVDDWNETRTAGWWWAAPINAKVTEAPCFYSATFTFTKVAASGTYTLTVATPDGAFTKTGALAGGLPGIPGSGSEGCYTYAGGTSSFVFAGSSTAIPATFPSTKTSISLSGVNTFIGYGATQKEYEILEITPTYMYLRARGTETGNAWYMKLKPKP
jgi:hypothetical protein